MAEPIQLTEWDEQFVPGSSLGRDTRTLSLLAADNGKIRLRELATGVLISSTSWIGVIHAGPLTVRIMPKLAGDAVDVVQMLMIGSGIDTIRRRHGVNLIDATDRNNVLDLLVLLFCDSVDRVVADGLLHDYVTREEDLAAMRGRLLVDQQAIRHFGRIDRLACRYDEHSTDIDENRLIAAALRACYRRVESDRIRRRARSLMDLFDEVCEINDFDWRDATQRLTYGRTNGYYREAHELARLILEGSTITDLLSAGATRSFAFLLDMNQLFERFVGKFVSWAVGSEGTTVSMQVKTGLAVTQSNGRTYSRIAPDVLVRQAHRVIPIDAKYKRYDTRHVAESDVYQCFVYAYAHADDPTETWRAGLIYPSETTNGDLQTLQIHNPILRQQVELRICGVHIPSALAEVRTGVTGEMAKAVRCLVQ